MDQVDQMDQVVLVDQLHLVVRVSQGVLEA